MENQSSYKILKKKNKLKKPIKRREDPEKEEIIKNIMKFFEEKGIRVRREKLQQGIGWKAISGTCKVNEDSVIFLDRRLEQDEQIVFLLEKLKEGNFKIEKETLEKFPQKARKVVGL